MRSYFFPSQDDLEGEFERGMELRDFFAAVVLHASMQRVGGWGEGAEEILVHRAYRIAEKMIQRREERPA